MTDLPDPVPLDLFRSLVDAAGGISQAAKLAHADGRNMGRWYSGAAPIPWSVAFVLLTLTRR